MIEESYDSATAAALLVPSKNPSESQQEQLPAAGLSTVESQRSQQSYRRRANKNTKRCEAMVASVKLSQGGGLDESYGQIDDSNNNVVPEYSEKAN